MRFHSKDFGSGFPLVILHGLFGSLDNWVSFGRSLADLYHIHLFDARNHGRSFHAEEFSFAVMAEDLRRYMEDCGIERAHLLGHSMGGKTVMQFALTYARMTERIVVVDVAPRGYESAHDHILAALEAVHLPSIRNRDDADRAMLPFLPDRNLRQFLLKNLIRADGGGYAWKINLPVLIRSYSEIAANITATGRFENPALFVRGGKSTYVADTDRETIRSLFPASTVVTINNAGHWLHAEAPAPLRSVVESFLGR